MRAMAACAAALGILAPGPGAALSIQSRPGERWAVLIGHDEDDAGRTAGELRELAAVLRRDFGYAPTHVLERYDADTGADPVRTALVTVLGRVQPADSLLLVVLMPTVGSGDDTSFVTHGGAADQPWTLLPLFELQKMLQDLPARASFVVLPACPSAMAQQAPHVLQSLSYSRSGERGVALATFCPEGGEGAAGRASFARELRRVLEGAPATGDPLDVGAVIDRLQSGEKGFRMQRPQFFPSGAAPQFAFVRQGRRLQALVDALGAATDPPQKASAIAALSRAVREEPAPGRPQAVATAGAALLPLITTAEVSDGLAARAAAALGEIGYEPAVPALGALLASGRATTARRAALDALVRIGGEAVLAHVPRALQDEDAAVRATAVRALAAGKDERALADLLRLAGDPSESVRIAVAQALGNAGARRAEARAAAEKMLEDPLATVRREAASALGALGPAPASPVLLRVLQADEDAAVRQAAAYSLGRSFVEADRAAVERALVAAARAADAPVREAALWSLQKVGGPQAERVLRIALRDPEAAVRRTAIEKLGEMASAASVPDLVRTLGDAQQPPDVRQAAARALGQVGDERAVGPLLEALKDESAYVREAADAALKLLKEPRHATPLVPALLRDPDPRVRAEAAQKVGESGNALYAPRLLALLADDDERVRQSAVAALATFKDPAVDERLLAATADRDFRIRQGALAALGQAGRLGTPARLLPLLKDPVASVRAEAVRALGRLGLPEHRQVLDAAADPDAGVRLALAETLAPLSSATAREALVALTRDRAVQVRQVAVGALSMKK